jgi:hypothetical protein
MLNELFSWFTTLSFPPPVVQQETRQTLQIECDAANKKHQRLLAEVRAERFEKTSSTKHEDLEYQYAYLNFLTFCLQELGEETTFNPYLFVIKYGLGDSKSLLKEEKLVSLFHLVFENNPQEAITFYEHNPALTLIPSIQICAAVWQGKPVVDQQLHTITNLLIHQEHSWSLIPLFKEWVGDIEQFAASILWLLQRGCSNEQIIETGVLNHFFAYHLGYLEDVDNPVRYFYALLSEYDSAQGLIKEANQVRCNERGFFSEAPSGHSACEGQTKNESHALTGNVCKNSMLKIVDRDVQPQPNFTVTIENFDSLYLLFKTSFLNKAIEQYNNERAVSVSGSFNLESLLIQLLNKPDVCEQLPTIINALSLPDKAAQLKNLSTLISEDTLTYYSDKGEGALLYLLPYKPNFANKISGDHLRQFLKKMPLGYEHRIERVSQLMVPFLMFQKSNISAARILFKAMLKEALDDPYYFLDTEFIGHLKRFSEKEPICLAESSHFQRKFRRCLKQMMKETLTQTNYHIIEDLWVSLSRKMMLLHDISHVESDLPSTIYQLRVLLIKHCLHQKWFDLDSMIAIFDVEAIFEPNEITVYERLLTEVLIDIDDAGLRDTIIEKFKSAGYINKLDRNYEYNEDSLLSRAVQAGNLGFIQTITIPAHHMLDLARKAVFAHQWNVAHHFISILDKVDKKTLRGFLSAAINDATLHASKLDTFKLCFAKASQPWKARDIECFAMKVVQMGNVPICKFLFNFKPNIPSETLTAKAFKIAVKANNAPLIRLLGNRKAHASIQHEVNIALKIQSKHGGITTVKALCKLIANPPTRDAIERSFKEAAKCGHEAILAFLCSLPNPPRPIVIDEALMLALENGFSRSVRVLCQQKPGPSQVTREEALLRAIELGLDHSVLQICGCSQEQLRERTLQKAWSKAKEQQQFKVETVLELISPKLTTHNDVQKKPERRASCSALAEFGMFQRHDSNKHRTRSTVDECLLECSENTPN